MSCGQPHETDCSEVLAEVWLLLDDECNESRRTLLREHIDECKPCLEEYGIHEHLKLLLARKCGGEHAPDSFKEKLRSTIRATVLEHGGPAAAPNEDAFAASGENTTAAVGGENTTALSREEEG